MPEADKAGQVKQWAEESGLAAAGVAPAEATGREGFLREWLARGWHGEMAYLARDAARRADVRRLFPWARSVICAAMFYGDGENWGQAMQAEPGRRGRIARYAWRRDYHEALRERLGQLAERMRSAWGAATRCRVCVDTAPLLEKWYAARAGLGWIGKHGLLMNERHGSWLVLGEVVTDAELPADAPRDDGCGDCELCLRACPTGALRGPRLLEARRCIAYLTIEARDRAAADVAGQAGPWLFGCDACQEACPYNLAAAGAVDAALTARGGDGTLELSDAALVDDEAFEGRFGDTPVMRAGRARLAALAQARSEQVMHSRNQ